MAITEALACSLPAVISPACHFPEVASESAGRIVELEPPVIAGALVELLKDPGLRARMGAAGRTLVTSRYTWPRIAEYCLAAYHRHS